MEEEQDVVLVSLKGSANPLAEGSGSSSDGVTIGTTEYARGDGVSFGQSTGLRTVAKPVATTAATSTARKADRPLGASVLDPLVPTDVAISVDSTGSANSAVLSGGLVGDSSVTGTGTGTIAGTGFSASSLPVSFSIIAVLAGVATVSYTYRAVYGTRGVKVEGKVEEEQSPILSKKGLSEPI